MAPMNFKRARSPATARQLVTPSTRKLGAQVTASKVIPIRARGARTGLGGKQSPTTCGKWLTITEAEHFGEIFK